MQTPAKTKFLRQYWNRIQKSCKKAAGFTFIELIIVVTIIAILSVSAWVALTGETDRARDAKRLQDLAQIQQALESYYIRNSFYPQPAPREEGRAIIVQKDDGSFELIPTAFAQTDNVQKNAWGYRPNTEALASCTVNYDNDTNTVVYEDTVCGGDIFDLEGKVIGWKGTISEKAGQNSVAVAKGEADEIIKNFGPEYIQNIGTDPKLSTNTALADVEADKYIYATYRGPLAATDFKNGATQYQLATTLEKAGPDERETYIIGNYTQKRGKAKDPHSLIGSGENVIINGQKIGQNNPKTGQKSQKELETELISKIDLFIEEIDFLLQRTTISDDAQNFLNEADDKVQSINDLLGGEEITADDLDSAQAVFTEVRDIIQEALNRFYTDAGTQIAQAVQAVIETDPSEQIKRDALAKMDDIADVRRESERFARNSADFQDLKEEFNARKQLEKQIELLLNEIGGLEEILAQKQDAAASIIPADLSGNLFDSRGDGFDELESPTRGSTSDRGVSGSTSPTTFNTRGPSFGGSTRTTSVGRDTGVGTTTSGDEDTGTTTTTTAPAIAQDDTGKELADLKAATEEIMADLFEVDKEDKKFTISFNNIILAIDTLEKDVNDLDSAIEESSGAIISQRDFEQWDRDFTATQDPKRRLELALDIQSKITGIEVDDVQVVFNESILGADAGQAGVVEEVGPMSPYSGIPVPLETGA